MAINLPDGIDNVFPSVVNGSVDGCSVYDSGSVRSAVKFGNNFSICDGWQQEWAQAATGTDATLVVVGAWDVFDIDDDGTFYGFATPAGDELFVTNLRSGIDAMLAQGTNVGLLEVACMRPQDVKGREFERCPNEATTPGWPTSTTSSVSRGVLRDDRDVAGAVRRRSRRVVQRRDDRHRPRLPLGRRARVQAGSQPDLHHGRSRPTPPRSGLNPVQRIALVVGGCPRRVILIRTRSWLVTPSHGTVKSWSSTQPDRGAGSCRGREQWVHEEDRTGW